MQRLLETQRDQLIGSRAISGRAVWPHRAATPLLICCIALLLHLFSFAAFAAETPIPAAPTRWVTDTTGFISPQARQSLDVRLESFERSSGHQVIVYIGDTTGDVPIEDWAVRAFEAWRVGRKGIDDGLVLFIMARDRKLRIEVGYGLEPVVPDATASRIIREVIVPAIQSGNNDAAIINGVNSIISVISGGSINGPPTGSVEQQSARNPEGAQRKPVGLLQMIFFGIIAIFILILFITNPWLAIQLLFMILSGGRGSGGGGGGDGGFRGGGGRSGGGGASGSW